MNAYENPISFISTDFIGTVMPSLLKACTLILIIRLLAAHVICYLCYNTGCNSLVTAHINFYWAILIVNHPETFVLAGDLLGHCISVSLHQDQ